MRPDALAVRPGSRAGRQCLADAGVTGMRRAQAGHFLGLGGGVRAGAAVVVHRRRLRCVRHIAVTGYAGHGASQGFACHALWLDPALVQRVRHPNPGASRRDLPPA